MADEGGDVHLCALMKSAQAGDAAAYSEVLRLSVPIVARIIRSQRTFGMETDDIVQDVLLALHSVRHTYDPDRPFVPWLAAIARHRLIDAQRRHARIAKNEAAVAVLPETSGVADSNKIMEGQGDPELLRRAIAELPAGQRQAVELLKLRELSLKEASAESGMSVAALKMAVHRGLKTLRLRLAGDDAEQAKHSK
ncbi:MAG: sigma-70 family RNA polymerase sigma factor [Alphaproteobacteria bacterium]